MNKHVRNFYWMLLCVVVVLLLVSCATAGDPSSSSYLLKSYGAPAEYHYNNDEMTGEKITTSPGIILFNSAIGWNNTCMWFVISDNQEKNYRMIIKANTPEWTFFDTVYVKLVDEVYKFSADEKTLAYDRSIVSEGNVEETVVCNMDNDLFKKIIMSENITLSIRGVKGKQDYDIPRQDIWMKMVEE